MTPEQADYARRVSVTLNGWTVMYINAGYGMQARDFDRYENALRVFRRYVEGTGNVRTLCIAHGGVIMVQPKH